MVAQKPQFAWEAAPAWLLNVIKHNMSALSEWAMSQCNRWDWDGMELLCWFSAVDPSLLYCKLRAMKGPVWLPGRFMENQKQTKIYLAENLWKANKENWAVLKSDSKRVCRSMQVWAWIYSKCEHFLHLQVQFSRNWRDSIFLPSGHAHTHYSTSHSPSKSSYVQS